VLTPRNVVDAATAAKPLGQRLREEYLTSERQAGEVIAAGKLADADMAAAFHERAMARSTLGDLAGAAADLAEATKRAPRAAEMLLTRASLAARQGRYPAAISDATRALTLGIDASSAYLERGQAKFLAGDAQGALDDLLQAEKVSTSGQTVGFMKIWQTLARLQLKQDLGAMPSLDGQWPAPILRMLWANTDARTAYQKAIQESRTASADESLKNECEVHFYAALIAKIRGDNARYQELLRKTVDTQVIYYTEYGLAQALLAAK
jgi:lipoprotein NlpI